MHKTLLNPIQRAECVNFSQFLRTDLQNLARKNFLEDFLDILWVESGFKPIRAISRTDSEVSWTRLYMMNPKKTNESKEFWISNVDNFLSMRAMKKP